MSTEIFLFHCYIIPAHFWLAACIFMDVVKHIPNEVTGDWDWKGFFFFRIIFYLMFSLLWFLSLASTMLYALGYCKMEGKMTEFWTPIQRYFKV